MTTPLYTSEQQVFDLVARHLLRQGRKSRRRNGECLYRSSNGDKCAVGALIPDNLYDPGMEDRPIHKLMPENGELRGLFGFDPGELLYELQAVHDTHHPRAWRGRLRAVAQNLDLSTSVLTEVP